MDKQKSLDMTLTQIERQFGKGAVMRLGDHSQRLAIESIPTGSMAIDIALGVGGFPRGRIIELYGPESSGKCLVGGTYVWTDRGLETIAELFARCGQEASCTSRVTDVSELGVRMVNERGELETVAALTHNGRRPVLELKLRSGRTLKVTQNHPLRVMDSSGFIVWRQAAAIAPGDTLVSAVFGAVEAAEGDGLSIDEAVLLGYLVAEGSLSSRNAVRFTNWDQEVGREFTSLMEGLFGSTVKCYYDKEYAVHDTALRQELADRYGLDYVNAAGKRVPHGVRTGGQKIQRAFLSALFEGDGWIDTSSTIGFASASEQLSREVQLLLYGFGIPATVTPKHVSGYDHVYWTVTVNPTVAERFLQEIGFRSARRRDQVAASFRPSPRDPQCENIPHLVPLLKTLRDDTGGDREFDRIAGDLFRESFGLCCSRSRLRKIVTWAERREERLPASSRAILSYLRSLSEARYTYEPVDAVEAAGVEPTFDVVLPDTHSFIANGVLSHNTTVALHVVAEAQKTGGVAAFIDAEHALDPVYAANIGVDIDALLVSQPDTGEQALEITDMLIRSSAIDIVVIDSVAALVPRAEIEGEMGDTHVGLQARLMSQAMRKLTGSVSKSRTCVVFINQIREKIGVMFGCFSYGTRVVLADGSREKIGKIVNQRMPVEVLSYDPGAGGVIPKRIVNWFDNGRTEGFLQFTVARPLGNGRAQFGCTPNHLIRTPGGWREAQEIAVGDRVLQAVPHYLSDFQWDVLLGGLMGDGALSPTRSGLGGRFRFGHGERQVAYGDWKAALFDNVGVSRSTNAKGAVFYDVRPLPELGELRRAVYIGGKKVLSDEYLKALTPLSLAIWYMDDGTFAIRATGVQARTADGSGRSDICVEAMESGTRDRLVRYLADTWGIKANLISRAGKAVLVFPKDETAKLHALVAQYIHPSMDYKLLPRFRGRFDVQPAFRPMRHELMAMPVLAIGPKPRARSTHRFDIEVEGSHNYLVDGVVVHNSPETTPGGRALKFYSSVRLEVRRVESIKDGAESIGNRVKAKVVKNKCIAEGALVFDPTTGQTHRIEDIVDNGAGTSVYAADKCGQLHVRPIVSRMDQGRQDVIGLRFRGGQVLWATPDHKVLSELGWREAGELQVGDAVARPRRAGTFGDSRPVPPEHARLLGHLAPGKCIAPAFFAPDVSADVVANLLFGYWESDGWVSREQTGGVRVGFTTTSEQLAHQVHWLLLRWGIASAVSRYRPGARRSLIAGRRVQGKLPTFEVRVSGVDNVTRFSEAIPMWGPRGQTLVAELQHPEMRRRHRGSRVGYLPATVTPAVVSYLESVGVTPRSAAQIVGRGDPQGGFRSVLGARRLRRDRIERLADALDSEFLRGILDEDVYYERIGEVLPARCARTFDIEIEDLHTFVADDVVVHNCAPPFKSCEFDIMFGRGISREGSLLDVAVEAGIIRKSGSWYTFESEQIGQGRENAKSFLSEHADVAAEIERRIRTTLLVKPEASQNGEVPEDALEPIDG